MVFIRFALALFCALFRACISTYTVINVPEHTDVDHCCHNIREDHHAVRSIAVFFVSYLRSIPPVSTLNR